MSSLTISKPTSFSTAEPSLSSRAMLCSLSISTWSARKHDPEASEEIAYRHEARPDAGRYHKVPSSKEALADIQKIVSEALRIDARQKKIPAVHWRSDHDRPIFFVELRERYVALGAKCTMDG